jgi:hypothetical protein
MSATELVVRAAGLAWELLQRAPLPLLLLLLVTVLITGAALVCSDWYEMIVSIC